MPRLSQRVLSLQESAIRKLDATTRARKDVHFHRVNIGQPDVPTPQPLIDAIAEFQPQILGYGPASGTPDCREAATAYHRRWCPELQPRHVAVTTGGSEALLFAFTAACDPGDVLLAPEPYYTNYNGFASICGASIRPLRTHLSQGFALPSDAELDAAVDERVKGLVVANPGNPTGAVYGREELQRLVDWALRHNKLLIVDEVYRQIWLDQAPASILEFPEAAEVAICVDSLSKTWSACGLRLGFLISRNEQLMEKVERLGQARLGPQPLAQHVGKAALALPEQAYADLRALYRERVDVLVEGLSGIEGVEVSRPRGAFYLMARLPVADTEAFARFLATDFEHEGESLVVAPGNGFYADPSRGRDEVRLAAVLEPERLRRVSHLLALALEKAPG